MSRPFAFRSALAGLRAENRPAALVVAGRFNRSAIMAEAVRVARMIRAGGASWQTRMGIALRTVWGRAKAAMVEAARIAAIPAIPVWTPSPRATRPAARDPVAFVRGSRSNSHGW